MSEIARLRWLCRRGMKELDVLMTHYLEHHYPGATAAEQQAFEALLQMPDPDLYSLILGRSESTDEDITQLIKILRATHAE
ncbi:MAG: succinate dehydrogenase assembly factor 2 [Gammaproteobacteria bacterium]|nr:succinate dehydrogenase assembly factor 2 [Gammaproteobacteria bacterium]